MVSAGKQVPKSAHGPGEGPDVLINRAPVLTLWAAVVAERLGFREEEALTLGRVVAGLNAYSKGRSLGIFKPTPDDVRHERQSAEPGVTWHVELLHRAVPVVRTPDGIRAVEKSKPVDPRAVERYLEGKFGDALEPVKTEFRALARTLAPDELSQRAYELYEAFRPGIPPGVKGWGAKGVLDLALVRSLTR